MINPFVIISFPGSRLGMNLFEAPLREFTHPQLRLLDILTLNSPANQTCKTVVVILDSFRRSHGKSQPPNNSDSNPRFAPEAARKRQSMTATPKVLD